MSSLKILTAAIAAATFSLAFAQGTPPRPATDAATGAGQRSSQGTPMGTTGTPGGSGATAQGSGTTGGTAASSAATSANMPAASSGTMAADTGTTTTTRKSKRVAKADRG